MQTIVQVVNQLREQSQRASNQTKAEDVQKQFQEAMTRIAGLQQEIDARKKDSVECEVTIRNLKGELAAKRAELEDLQSQLHAKNLKP